MDFSQLRSQTPQALARQMEEARVHLHDLSGQIASHQLKNVREVRKTRELIARIETILHQKSGSTPTL